MVAVTGDGAVHMELRNRFCRSIVVLSLAFGLSATATALAAHQKQTIGAFNAAESRDIQKIIREYILNHPEVIIEAMERLSAKEKQAEALRRQQAAAAVNTVISKDHIVGNPDAPVKIVEYSDFECPFCKRFHKTMKRVSAEYGKEGQFAWIYRHFPIDEIHSKARKEAQAAECANELGGNDAFWKYTDKLYEITPSNNRLDLAILPKLAEDIGLDRTKFETCLEGDERGGKYADHIEADAQNARASGGRGTPFSVVITANGLTFPINGAQPYGAIKSIIDLALKKTDLR